MESPPLYFFFNRYFGRSNKIVIPEGLCPEFSHIKKQSGGDPRQKLSGMTEWGVLGDD